VNFDWGSGAPAEGIGRNQFSVRWEGELEAQFSEPYAIHMTSDDRARVWINGELLIDEWYEHGEASSEWVPFAYLSTVTEYRATDQKCRESYLGEPGGWQGPWQ
jgi:PA14 domain